MYTRGKRTQHGKPDSVVGRDDQPEAGDGQRGRYGVAERPIVPGKPGNAGGGNRLRREFFNQLWPALIVMATLTERQPYTVRYQALQWLKLDS